MKTDTTYDETQREIRHIRLAQVSDYYSGTG